MNLQDGDLLRCMWERGSPARSGELRRLLAEGANPNGHTSSGISFLAIAAKKADKDAVAALLEAGASVEPDPQSHNSIVALAATGLSGAHAGGEPEERRDEDRIAILKLLRQAGANFEERSSVGMTPLAKTIERSDEVSLALIELGADVLAKNDAGQTLLSIAMLHGSPEMAFRLIELGVDINEANKYQETCLIEMVEMGDAHAVKMLVEWGADANAPEAARKTSALHVAVRKKSLAKAEILIKAGADPDIHDDQGATPLMMAAKAEFGEMLKLLLDSGANPWATDNAGRIAKDYCSPSQECWAHLEAVDLSSQAPNGAAAKKAPRI